MVSRMQQRNPVFAPSGWCTVRVSLLQPGDMGSSCENNLFACEGVRPHLSPEPAMAGASCIRLPFSRICVEALLILPNIHIGFLVGEESKLGSSGVTVCEGPGGQPQLDMSPADTVSKHTIFGEFILLFLLTRPFTIFLL